VSVGRVVSGLYKPRQTVLLVFTGVVAYLKACELGFDPLHFLIYALSTTLAVAGTTGVNMYFDRDIDSVMERTRRRYALPLGLITPSKALTYSLLMVAAGLILALALNFWVFLAGLLGFLIDILLYTVLLKRRTPRNVVRGGVAGGMPAFGGWAAIKGPAAECLVFTALIAFWSMTHIWLLASYFHDDYRRAGVPMLPVVIGERKGVIAALLTLTLAEACLLVLQLMGVMALGGVLITIPMYVLVVAAGMKAVLGEREKVWLSFKLASIYLAVAFIALFI